MISRQIIAILEELLRYDNEKLSIGIPKCKVYLVLLIVKLVGVLLDDSAPTCPGMKLTSLRASMSV